MLFPSPLFNGLIRAWRIRFSWSLFHTRTSLPHLISLPVVNFPSVKDVGRTPAHLGRLLQVFRYVLPTSPTSLGPSFLPPFAFPIRSAVGLLVLVHHVLFFSQDFSRPIGLLPNYYGPLSVFPLFPRNPIVASFDSTFATVPLSFQATGG